VPDELINNPGRETVCAAPCGLQSVAVICDVLVKLDQIAFVYTQAIWVKKHETFDLLSERPVTE